VAYSFDERSATPHSPLVPEVVYRGSRPLCQEFSLLLEAQAIDHELLRSADGWELLVMPDLADRAHEEIKRYSAERGAPPVPRELEEPFSGAAIGAVGYTVVLLATAYFAGIHLFGADWLSVGALRAGSMHEWWRALTALTLHLDQEHLLGNLLFGVVAGAAAGRLLGPGIAWASILGAAVLANCVEISVAPAGHLAVGASTAVFAALGLLAGMAWRRRLTLRERRWYRWAPLIAGICLLTFLGSGPGGTAATAHVDVLGHALGFLFGTGVGWLYARLDIPRDRSKRLQIAAGAGAVLMLCAAWMIALGRTV
jgi:membrane associated rhomboid family serine protease